MDSPELGNWACVHTKSQFDPFLGLITHVFQRIRHCMLSLSTSYVGMHAQCWGLICCIGDWIASTKPGLVHVTTGFVSCCVHHAKLEPALALPSRLHVLMLEYANDSC
jgi:hypothetical protein